MSAQPAGAGGPGESPDRAQRLSALFDTHSGRLYRLARRLTSTKEDAVDLVQDTFLRVAATAKPLPHEFTVEEAWLVRILVNIRRDQWRKDAVRKRHPPHGPSAGDLPTDTERALMTRLMVWQALDVLSPRRRAIVVLHELDGMSAVSIAALLGITAITVRWHLVRARRELAARLCDTGDTNERSKHSVARRRSIASRHSTS